MEDATSKKLIAKDEQASSEEEVTILVTLYCAGAVELGIAREVVDNLKEFAMLAAEDLRLTIGTTVQNGLE